MDMEKIYNSVGLELSYVVDITKIKSRNSDLYKNIESFFSEPFGKLLVIDGGSDKGRLSLLHTIVKIYVDNRVQSYITDLKNFMYDYKNNNFNIPGLYVQPKVLAFCGLESAESDSSNIDFYVIVNKFIKSRISLNKTTIIEGDFNLFKNLNNFKKNLTTDTFVLNIN